MSKFIPLNKIIQETIQRICSKRKKIHSCKFLILYLTVQRGTSCYCSVIASNISGQWEAQILCAFEGHDLLWDWGHVEWNFDRLFISFWYWGTAQCQVKWRLVLSTHLLTAHLLSPVSCWLSIYESVVWALVGPICAIVIIILLVFVMAIRASLTLKGHIEGFGNLRYVTSLTGYEVSDGTLVAAI